MKPSLLFVVLALIPACTQPSKPSTAAPTEGKLNPVSTEGELAAPVATEGKLTAPIPVVGKFTAPVALEAELTERSARITVRFEAAATGVNLDIYGVDGLAVRGEPTVVHDGSFNKGDTTVFQVAFVKGPGRSHLAVAITGLFSGSKLNRIATFAVGTATEAEMKGPATKVTTESGSSIKVLPAK